MLIVNSPVVYLTQKATSVKIVEECESSRNESDNNEDSSAYEPIAK